jgi:GntR family transcriptional regulator
MFDDTSPIFQQLADSLADEVLRGLYAEGDQVPSINELAAFHRINPATANRAVALLVDQGVLIKRRGVGMFVADGALTLIRTARRAAFEERFLTPLLAEARTLGIDPDSLVALIRKEATS